MTNYKIDFCSDAKQIINIWHIVFGDSAEEILFFLQNCKNKKCLGVFTGDKLVSMLFLVDCKYGSLNGKYIYAVATLNEYRCRGFAGKLVEKAKQYAGDFLWLIPANEVLMDFYKKFGFEIKLYSEKEYDNKILFKEKDNIIEYLYEGCELKKPIGMVWSKTDFSNGNIGIDKE